MNTPRTEAVLGARQEEMFFDDLLLFSKDITNLCQQLEHELQEAQKAVTEVCLREQLALEDYKFEKNRADQCNLELAEAYAEIDRLDVRGIHSCHQNCQRPMCVLRRELATAQRERDNAISDHKQADTDTLRALHERNEARRELQETRESMPWHSNGETKDEWFQRQRDKFSALEKELADAREQLKKADEHAKKWARLCILNQEQRDSFADRLRETAEQMVEARQERDGYHNELIDTRKQRDRLAEAIKRHKKVLHPITSEKADAELWKALAAVEGGSRE